ncbi:uncharacterized protein MONOS_2818 [Monocercomonoides exilis]|uniref:uncharacterized protein n=1 Tax=Monocercomonoides exilis TaxID=2049356 RepID=UPI003559A922|nr:hypothetical protein MONOS_2818 [Monocercomonoides exilis]|eukprot:MONOS_2818.1-p1 / transcript=MONOS_2818.1 / gene=MONOS_2818 / organism=Monocercomonoides_exilis_PA203 / gene_product=unspecified product / transcript_product=unspecified product / location=Mono_scaffold00060:132067-132758(+) / protein_length=155 / sequence_SO=supercontig / SO=protein_coding / is_pseudo=false
MTENEKSSSSSSSSSAPAIDPSDDSKAEASFITSTTTMDNIESRLRIVESEECEVCANQKKSLPCALQTLRGYIVSRRVVVKLDDEVMGRGVEVCDMGEIVENGLSVVGLRMEDMVLSSAAIALAVLEKREEAEEAKEKEKKEGKEVDCGEEDE